MYLSSIQGVYGICHIIYLTVSLILMILSLVLIKRFIKSEKTIDLIIKISGIVLFVFIITNRISVTYYDVVKMNKDGYSWLNLLPNTFCGLASLLVSLSIIFGKKDNKVLNSITYIGVIGGIITIFYPDFLQTQDFFDIRSITGLLHHTLMAWIVILCMLTKYIKPSMKKWHYLPLALALVMTYGLFEKDALKFTKAMQINEPLLSSAPFITSWYFVGIVLLILHFIYLLLYELLINKKQLSKIFK